MKIDTFPDFLKSSVYRKFRKYVDNIDSDRTHSCLNPKQVSSVRKHFEQTTLGKKSFSFTLKWNFSIIFIKTGSETTYKRLTEKLLYRYWLHKLLLGTSNVIIPEVFYKNVIQIVIC